MASPRLSCWPRALVWLIVAGTLAASCRRTARRTADVEAGAADATRLKQLAGAADTTRLRQLREAVARQIGKPSCSEQPQCRAMPIGSKPCGGPWSYVVFSTVATDSAALALAVQRYNAAEEELNRKLSRVSDCSFVSPPKPDCARGRCTTLGSGIGKRR